MCSEKNTNICQIAQLCKEDQSCKLKWNSDLGSCRGQDTCMRLLTDYYDMSLKSINRDKNEI